jgi:multisubunit Na+/H+ antiporter MnhF subunit
VSNVFLIAAFAMLVAALPAAVTLCRGPLADSVIAYEFVSSVAVLVFILLAQGFRRPSEFEFPVVLAVLLYGGGLVYVRALERWL